MSLKENILIYTWNVQDLQQMIMLWP